MRAWRCLSCRRGVLTLLHTTDFAETALKAFANNPYDLPFVQLFTVEEVNNKPSRREVRLGYDRSTRTIIKLTNRGSTGIPQDHPFHVQEALVDVTPPMSRQSSSSASTSTGTGSTATAMDLRERLDAASMLSPATAVGSPATSSASNASTASATGHSGAVPQWTWPFEEACLKRDAILVEDLGPLAESLDRSRGWSYPARQAVVIPIFVEVGQTIPSAVVVFGINAMSRYTSLMEVFFNLVARHVAIGLFAVLAAEQDRHRADELMKLDRAKTSFFSSVSHELRTPLTLILGPLEDLLTGAERHKLDRDQREKLVLVQRHANRLLTLVNKLLDFSSIEGGRMSFKFRPVQIVRPVQSKCSRDCRRSQYSSRRARLLATLPCFSATRSSARVSRTPCSATMTRPTACLSTSARTYGRRSCSTSSRTPSNTRCKGTSR